MLKKVQELFFQGKLTLVVIIGSISWCLTMVKSGILYPFGLGFWGANGHDGIWHIALAQSLAKGSLEMPTFAGERLQNYHIGFDLVMGLIGRITSIPVSALYFQVIPPILAVAIGLLTYKLVLVWSESKSASLWSVFFVYFGGSLGFLIGKGESTFWSQQAISTLINPPFALSLVIILGGLILLLKKKYLWAALLFGILIEIKAYAGILALGSLLVLGIWEMIKVKKFNYQLVFVGSLVISALLFIPLNIGSENLFVFKPFWFLETMMGLSDRVGWDKFYSAMFNYRAGGIWYKAIPAYLIAFVIFSVGNLGTRIIKDLWILKKLKNLRQIDEITLFSFSMIGAGILIPTFFLQKGTPWNTIQFFYYALFFSAMLAGVAVNDLFKNKSKTFVAVGSLVIVLLTIPTTLMTLSDVYIPSRPPAKISKEELAALNFLKTQPNGVVLTYPFDEAKAKEAIANPPRPLYLYESTAYVSAYANKPTYLEDQVNLDITGYDWRVRRQKVFDFINERNVDSAKDFLGDNNIKYLYLVKGSGPLVGEQMRLGSEQLGLRMIFDNEEVVIYLVGIE